MLEEPESKLDNPEPFVDSYRQRKNEINQPLGQEVHARHFRQDLRETCRGLPPALKQKPVADEMAQRGPMCLSILPGHQ